MARECQKNGGGVGNRKWGHKEVFHRIAYKNETICTTYSSQMKFKRGNVSRGK